MAGCFSATSAVRSVCNVKRLRLTRPDDGYRAMLVNRYFLRLRVLRVSRASARVCRAQERAAQTNRSATHAVSPVHMQWKPTSRLRGADASPRRATVISETLCDRASGEAATACARASSDLRVAESPTTRLSRVHMHSKRRRAGATGARK